MTALRLLDYHPEPSSFRDDVVAGLSLPRKRIPPKYLYDRRGSRLFDRICALTEYYVTRTELLILEEHAHEMAWALGSRAALIEFGSGASRKVRYLLDRLEDPAAYVPIDISRELLLESANALAADYPRLRIVPVCADFTRRFRLPDAVLTDAWRRAAFFPGSTFGNFDPPEARRFLTATAELLGPGGLFLLGVDLVKPRTVLEAAYNDAGGVTAAFNLNLLERMRSELGAELDPAGFSHRAIFNEIDERVEMHLVSERPQAIRIGSVEIPFGLGETIHTESSYKFRPERLGELASSAGWRVVRHWMDRREYFAIFLMKVLDACEDRIPA